MITEAATDVVEWLAIVIRLSKGAGWLQILKDIELYKSLGLKQLDCFKPKSLYFLHILSTAEPR